jgi:hypothetical protein
MSRVCKARYETYAKAWYSDLDTPHCDRQLLLTRSIVNKIDSPNTWQVADDFDVELLEQFGIANAGTLQDLWGAESTTAEHDHLSGFNNSFHQLATMATVSGRNICNPDGLATFEDDAVDTRVGTQVEVTLNVHHAVNVG